MSSKSPKLRKKKKSIASTGDKSTTSITKDSIPTWLPPPENLGVKVSFKKKVLIRNQINIFRFFIKLLEAVEYHPLDDRDLFGLKISFRVLKHLSPTEIRDLLEVFQEFDRDGKG